MLTERLQALFPTSAAAVALLDAGGRILFCSAPLTERPPEALAGTRLAELVPEENRATLEVALADAISPALTHTLELPLRRPGGGLGWYQLTLGPARGEGGAAVVAALADVSARHAELERLRRSEQLVFETEAAAQFGIWEWDLAEPHARWSEQLFRIYGLDPRSHVPSYQDYLTRVHPDDRERVRQATEGVIKNRQPYSHDERVFRPNGELRHLHTWAQPRLDSQGKLVGLIGVCQDITERAQAEAERDALLQRVRQAFAETTEAERRANLLAGASRELAGSLEVPEVARRAARAGLGLPADWCLIFQQAPVGPLAVQVAHPDLQAEARARARLADAPGRLDEHSGPGRVAHTGKPARLTSARGKRLAADPLVIACDGQTSPITSWLGVPLVARGEVLGVLSLYRAKPSPPFTRADLELACELGQRVAVALDNASLYQQVRASVRVRDDFIAVASHELRTPLTSLNLELELLERRLAASDRPAPVDPALRALHRQLDRLGLLVDNLLESAQVEAGLKLSLKRVRLDSLVRQVAERARPDLDRAGCELRLEMEEGVTGWWDAFRLEQVLDNLLSNAAKFGPGQPVEIAVRRIPGGVRLSVRDHGIGISPEDVARVFGRYERAVPSSQYGGLGLGLFIARQIVEAHRGTLQVESRAGEGSRFVVDLPYLPPPLVSVAAQQPPA